MINLNYAHRFKLIFERLSTLIALAVEDYDGFLIKPEQELKKLWRKNAYLTNLN